MLNVLDEFTHECLAIRVARKLKAIDVIDVLSDLFILRGVPAHIRSDNGPEFVAKAVREWIAAVGAKTAYIERGSPWENGYIESFNARLRDEAAQRRDLLHFARPRSSSRALWPTLRTWVGNLPRFEKANSGDWAIYSISSSAVIGHERVVRIAGVHETVAGLAQITIQLDLGRRSLTVPPPSRPPSHQHQRCSCLHSPRGRLRYADRLRRPHWRNGQP